MRVIGYVRVSTAGQAERLGPAAQERAIRAWCKRAGHKLVRIESDLGQSGKRGVAGGEDYGLDNGLGARPALSRALADLEAGQADALVVYDLTRLSRSAMWQEIIQHKLAAKGRRVFVVNASDDGLDEMTRKLLRTILGGIAEYEHAMIRARFDAGKAVKRAHGGFIGGQVPYGVRAEDAELVADEAEQATLARIRQLAGEGLSLRQMARKLEAEGRRPKRSERWHPETLRKLLARLEIRMPATPVHDERS